MNQADSTGSPRGVGVSMVQSTFGALLDAAPDAMVIVDQAGVMVLVNAQVERLFGYARTELHGQPVERLVPARFRGRHPAHRAQYGHEPRVREMGSGLELYAARKDGTEFPVEISLSPLETEQGMVTICAIRDITERRRARQKDLLLREIHHRVKNNLQVISSILKLHAERMQAPEARAAFEDTQQRVRAIALLHEQLHQAPASGPVALAPYLRAVVASLLGAAGDGVQAELVLEELDVSLDQALPVGLIFNELVTNAMKHALPPGAEGPLRLRVESRRDGERATLVVADNGTGFVGEPRSDSLGLHLVRTLTRQLDGELELSSDGGARVRIVFPLEDSGGPGA